MHISPEKKQFSVLIVDDDPMWVNLLKGILEEHFEEIESASSLQEGIEKLKTRSRPFHVVLSDIRLDDANKANREGMQLISWVGEYGGYTNILIMTGYPEIATVREAIGDRSHYKAFDYLEKYPPEGLVPEEIRAAVIRAAQDADQKRWLNRILLVEDESDWQDYLRTLLEDDGYFARIVMSFESALEQIERQPYRLVVVNLNTGGESSEEGMNFIAKLNRSSPETKVIATSSEMSIAQLRKGFIEFSLTDFFLRETQRPRFDSLFSEDEFRRSVWKVCAPVNIRFIVSRLEQSGAGDCLLVFQIVREAIAKEQGIPISLPPNRPSIELTVKVTGHDVTATPAQKTWYIPAEGMIDPLVFQLILGKKGELTYHYEISAPNGWGDKRSWKANFS